MKKKKFVSEQEVKNLVERGDYWCKTYYTVDIPMQFFTKNRKSGMYILHSETEQFQDFVKKVKEELLCQNKLSNAKKIEDIICDIELGVSGLGRLFFSNYNDCLEEEEKMKQVNFISKEEVKKLVEDGKYCESYYIVSIPNHVDLKNEGQFQDFLEKAKEEVFHQNKVKGAEQAEDIVYDIQHGIASKLALSFTSFKEYLEDPFKINVSDKKITHTIEVEIPILFYKKGYNKAMEWIRKMTKTIYKKYISDKCRTDVDWKLLSNGSVQFEVVQSQFK